MQVGWCLFSFLAFLFSDKQGGPFSSRVRAVIARSSNGVKLLRSGAGDCVILCEVSKDQHRKAGDKRFPVPGLPGLHGHNRVIHDCAAESGCCGSPVPHFVTSFRL